MFSHVESPTSSGGNEQGFMSVEMAAFMVAGLSLLLSVLLVIEPSPFRKAREDYFASFFANDGDVPMSVANVTVKTSGYRKDKGGNIWSGANLIDGDLKTAWSECRTEDEARKSTERRNPCDEPRDRRPRDERCTSPGATVTSDVVQGINEYAEMTLPTKTELKAVYIQNGNQKSDQVFLRNPRVKKLEVKIDGKFISDLDLTDEKGPQRFDVKASGTRIRFTIKATYPGECIIEQSKNDNGMYYYDASIAEISLIPAKTPSTDSK